jgi:hypothetical protein
MTSDQDSDQQCDAADKRGPTCWHRNNKLGTLAQEPCRPEPKIAKRWLGESAMGKTTQEIEDPNNAIVPGREI